MSFTDEDDDDNENENPDDINEYHDSEESSFSGDDEKVKILSKKQKQTLAVKALVRTAKQHFTNREFLNFQQDLKALSDEILRNKWTADSYKMPKFYVKHMLEIYNKLQELDPNQEENQKEKRQLKLLKRNFQKEIYHFKQLQVFEANEAFWKDEESDLGEMDLPDDHDQNDDSDDDGALYGIQDTAKPDRARDGDDGDDQERDDVHVDDEDDQDDDDEDDDEANGGTSKAPKKRGKDQDDDEEDDNDEEDDDDDDDGDESSWSSWEGAAGTGGQDEQNEEEDEEPDSDEEEAKPEAAGAAAAGGGGAGGGDDAFYAGFDDETLAKMRNRSFWVKKTKVKKKKPLTEKQKKRKAKTTKGDKKGGDKEDDEAASDEEEKTDKQAVKGKASKKEPRRKEMRVKEWSVSRIREVFQDVLQSRGKTSVNRNQIVSQLEQLIEQCELHKAEQARLTSISVLIAFYFETAERKTTGMSGTRWRSTRTLVTQMLKSLSKNVDTLRMSNDADIRLILKDDDKNDGVEKQDEANLAWMTAIQSVDESGASSSIRPAASSSGSVAAEDKTKKFGLDAFAVVQIEKSKKKLDPNYQWIQGNLVSYIRKLTAQLWSNLKSLEPKSEQYEKRRKNADLLVKTYKQAIHYFAKLGQKDVMAEMEVLWMAVIYDDYDEKMDELALKEKQSKKASSDDNKEEKEDEKKTEEQDDGTKDQQQKPAPKAQATQKPTTPHVPSLSAEFRGQQILNLPDSLIVTKAVFVFEHGSTRCQTQAMLYLIYNMAKHNKYELCRDLLLMSHLGSSSRIGQTNVEIQVLYNRALARYAICSFCNGQWYSAMIILQELFASARIKLLLAQGYFRAPQENASADQLKNEQEQYARMLPHHFHINHDILEAAHLLSSLFIEIPNMISNSYNKSFIRNQHFRKVWHQYLRRDLRVPPENTKDYILTTGIMMQNGEYQTCKKIVNKLRLWSELKHPRFVKKKVLSTLKRECMRCYLYRYGCVYETISIQRLSEMFELSPAHTKQYISKLIITAGSDSKFASLDELTQCVVMHQSPPMPIQRTALEYSDKLSFLIEQNEKLLGIYSRYSAFGGSKAGKFGKSAGGKDAQGDKKDDGKQDNRGNAGRGRGRGRGGGGRGGGGGRFNRNNQGGMMRPKPQQTQLRTFGRK